MTMAHTTALSFCNLLTNTTIIVFSAILICLLAPSGRAHSGCSNNNILISGKILNTGEQLAVGNYSLVMQEDCNLVLHNGGWESHTAHRGDRCRLTVDDDGRLVIRTGSGAAVWSSPAAPWTPRGKFAAVLEPKGRLVLYGPAVWSTVSGELLLGRDKLSCIGGGWHDNCITGDAAVEKNVLFSGEILYGGGGLTSGKYRFVMQEDCNLVLYDSGGGGWQSDTRGNEDHCFLRLDHRGGLEIMDDSYNSVWSNGVTTRPGDYVAVLQDDGTVVVYGPAIWSTPVHRWALLG